MRGRMILAPAVTVHDAAGARMALAAAARRCPGATLPLLSPPGAARWLTPETFLAMLAPARRDWPGQPCLPVLDCGDAPGFALAALRAGLPAVVLGAGAPGRPAVEAVAVALGAAAWRRAPPSLVLRPPLGSAMERALDAWLDGGAGDIPRW